MKRTARILALAVTVPAVSLAGPGFAADSTSTGTSTGTSTDTASWGYARSADHVLRSGCHDYDFRYVVRAPGPEWSTELTLKSPRHRNVASHTFTSAADARRAHRTWGVCDSVAKPGRYTITMKVTSFDESGDATVRRVRPSHFRFEAR